MAVRVRSAHGAHTVVRRAPEYFVYRIYFSSFTCLLGFFACCSGFLHSYSAEKSGSLLLYTCPPPPPASNFLPPPRSVENLQVDTHTHTPHRSTPSLPPGMAGGEWPSGGVPLRHASGVDTQTLSGSSRSATSAYDLALEEVRQSRAIRARQTASAASRKPSTVYDWPTPQPSLPGGAYVRRAGLCGDGDSLDDSRRSSAAEGAPRAPRNTPHSPPSGSGFPRVAGRVSASGFFPEHRSGSTSPQDELPSGRRASEAAVLRSQAGRSSGCSAALLEEFVYEASSGAGEMPSVSTFGPQAQSDVSRRSSQGVPSQHSLSTNADASAHAVAPFGGSAPLSALAATTPLTSARMQVPTCKFPPNALAHTSNPIPSEQEGIVYAVSPAQSVSELAVVPSQQLQQPPSSIPPEYVHTQPSQRESARHHSAINPPLCASELSAAPQHPREIPSHVAASAVPSEPALNSNPLAPGSNPLAPGQEGFSYAATPGQSVSELAAIPSQHAAAAAQGPMPDLPGQPASECVTARSQPASLSETQSVRLSHLPTTRLGHEEVVASVTAALSVAERAAISSHTSAHNPPVQVRVAAAPLHSQHSRVPASNHSAINPVLSAVSLASEHTCTAALPQPMHASEHLPSEPSPASNAPAQIQAIHPMPSGQVGVAYAATTPAHSVSELAVVPSWAPSSIHRVQAVLPQCEPAISPALCAATSPVASELRAATPAPQQVASAVPSEPALVSDALAPTCNPTPPGQEGFAYAATPAHSISELAAIPSQHASSAAQCPASAPPPDEPQPPSLPAMPPHAASDQPENTGHASIAPNSVSHEVAGSFAPASVGKSVLPVSAVATVPPHPGLDAMSSHAASLAASPLQHPPSQPGGSPNARRPSASPNAASPACSPPGASSSPPRASTPCEAAERPLLSAAYEELEQRSWAEAAEADARLLLAQRHWQEAAGVTASLHAAAVAAAEARARCAEDSCAALRLEGGEAAARMGVLWQYDSERPLLVAPQPPQAPVPALLPSTPVVRQLESALFPHAASSPEGAASPLSAATLCSPACFSSPVDLQHRACQIRYVSPRRCYVAPATPVPQAARTSAADEPLSRMRGGYSSASTDVEGCYTPLSRASAWRGV